MLLPAYLLHTYEAVSLDPNSLQPGRGSSQGQEQAFTPRRNTQALCWYDKWLTGAGSADPERSSCDADNVSCAGSNSSSSQASDQTQLNGAVTSKPQKGAPAKGKKEEARLVDLSLLSLKVGVIRKAERHPDAETLYVEEVDCGEEQPRTVQPPHPAFAALRRPFTAGPCQLQRQQGQDAQAGQRRQQ